MLIPSLSARKHIAVALGAALLVGAPGPLAPQAAAQMLSVRSAAGFPAGIGARATSGAAFAPLSATSLTAAPVLLAAPAASVPNAAPVPFEAAAAPPALVLLPAASRPAADGRKEISPLLGETAKAVGGSDAENAEFADSLFDQSGPHSAAEIVKAFAEQPRAELAKTIARASVESPLEYRRALRAALDGLLPGVPRLQRHLTALDADGDGKVSLRESYGTLRSLSFGRLKAAVIAAGSQLALVASTGRIGAFSFAVAGGPKGLHRSVDSGAMDPDQNLSKKLDEFMAEDADHDGWIDMKDVGRLIDKRARMSTSGRIAKLFVKAANKAEFAALFGLMGGRMSREDLRDFYTGSLFFGLLAPDALARRIVGLRERR